MKGKKFFVPDLDTPNSGYEIYAKRGTLRGVDRANLNTRNTQIRVVPTGSNWLLPTGVEGHTLGRLEEDGDGMVIWLDGKEKKIKLDYSQLNVLQCLLEAHDRIADKWWAEPKWVEEDYGFKMDEED